MFKPFGFAALAERLGAIRHAHAQISQIPDQATQDQVTRIFGLLRPPPPEPTWTDHRRMSPTLRMVHDAVARSATSISAAEVADTLGISRATAQRYLTQLEQTGTIKLELRYGSAGRPEHRYSANPR